MIDAKTLEALKKSIKKWNRKKVIDHGVDNCALCQAFSEQPGCEGCPVAKVSCRSRCWGTPYEDWVNHHDKEHSDFYPLRTHIGCPECVRLAQAELDFLKSLLPEETK